MVRRREKLKNRIKKRKSKRKGIERSLTNPPFLDKLVSGLRFPITRFYAKNIQKMEFLNEDHTSKIHKLVTQLQERRELMNKRERKVSRKLAEKEIFIDQVDFFENVNHPDLLPQGCEDYEECP